MGLIALIRKLYYRDGLGIREIARTMKLSRNTVRKYLSVDATEATYSRRASVSVLDDYATTLTTWLSREAKRKKKQRKSVRQLYRDLAELGYTGSYDRVAAFSRQWRQDRIREQEAAGKRSYVPLSFAPGEAFQFDWSEDWFRINGQRTKLIMAHFKMCSSRAGFVRAYYTQSHEMLFDAHNHAFRVFGGVPERGIYDNMRTAVDKVGRGKERTVNRRFQAMVSHYVFEADFCNPAAGWEKGIVEKAVHDARNQIYHQASNIESLEALNQWLEFECVRQWHECRHPECPESSIAEMLEQEKPYLMEVKHAFDGYVETAKRVSSTCLIAFERNRYSVPASYANAMVSVKAYPDRLVVVAEDKVICEHKRCFEGRGHDGRYKTLYDWRHYLTVAQRKPGSLRNGAPFKTMPAEFLELQKHLLRREGGDREMADILALVLMHPEQDVIKAVSYVLKSELINKQQVLNMLSLLRQPKRPEPIEAPSPLSLSIAPTTNITKYDQLRGRKQ